MPKRRATSEDYRISLVSIGDTAAVDFQIEVAYGVRIHKSNKTKPPRNTQVSIGGQRDPHV